MTITPDIHEGMTVPRFGKGGEKVTSLNTRNLLVKIVNAFINMLVWNDGTTKFELAEANSCLRYDGGTVATSGPPGFYILDKGDSVFYNPPHLFYVPGQFDQYIRCFKTNDGINPISDTPTLIAKPPSLRWDASAVEYRPIDNFQMLTNFSDPQASTLVSIYGQSVRGEYNLDDTTVYMSEVITPPYVTGDLIFAGTCEHTGVFVDGIELTLIDMNMTAFRRLTHFYGD